LEDGGDVFQALAHNVNLIQISITDPPFVSEAQVLHLHRIEADEPGADSVDCYSILPSQDETQGPRFTRARDGL